MRKPKPGTYGFTTTPTKMSIGRIASEAKKHQNFLLVHSKNTKTNRDFVTVMIRQSALPAVKDGFTLVGKPLGKTNWGKLVNGFRYAFLIGDDARKLANKAKADLIRLKNVLHDRIIRVEVEAVQHSLVV